jgi:hypothetical protein
MNAIPRSIDFAKEVLFRSYLDEDKEGVVLAIADFGGQSNLGEPLYELLKGRDGILLVCTLSMICQSR